MSFELQPNPEAEAIALTQQLAQDAVTIATQFDTLVLKEYLESYRNYWKIGREFDKAQLQRRSDRLGPTEIKILIKSGIFRQAISSMGAELESKYAQTPYDYTIVDVRFQNGETFDMLPDLQTVYLYSQSKGDIIGGRLILGDLREDWK